MRFPPRPENDFANYIQTYYRECRGRFPKIDAIAGKWMFRDLIPGMSDFDTRFIVRNEMTVEDWCQMSDAVGKAHLEICRKYPCWYRNLEHLPGVNVTWNELTAEKSYYPEYQQWTFYQSEGLDELSRAQRFFAERPWDIKDEYFHLKRFCLYYGRYDRNIDPPINLGLHAKKYPLHSRVMHYFNPPVHSAVCLLEKRNFPGKLGAFEIAEGLFPSLPCWEMINDILHSRYECPEYYADNWLTRLEDELERSLVVIAQALRDETKLIPASAGTHIPDWKKALSSTPVDPALVILDNSKFARLMKGRLYFYLNAPPRFDTLWLMQNELKRIGSNFFTVPFRTYWKVKTGQDVADPVTILDQLEGNPLTKDEVAATRQFASLTALSWEGEERNIIAQIVEVFDNFYKAMAHLTE